jgi:NADH-quinone oxidoreductase subunit M
VLLGLASLDLIGVQGAMIQMVSHGLTAAGLFMMVGMIYERCHTRALSAYGGLAKLLPVYSVFFMILTLASVGLPSTSGFTGELLVLLGAFHGAWTAFAAGDTLPLAMSVLAVSGVLLGALYMLRFAQHFLFGAPKAPCMPLTDLVLREKLVLAAIVAGVFLLGLAPAGPLHKTEAAARTYIELVVTPRLPGSAP